MLHLPPPTHGHLYNQQTNMSSSSSPRDVTSDLYARNPDDNHDDNNSKQPLKSSSTITPVRYLGEIDETLPAPHQYRVQDNDNDPPSVTRTARTTHDINAFLQSAQSEPTTNNELQDTEIEQDKEECIGYEHRDDDIDDTVTIATIVPPVASAATKKEASDKDKEENITDHHDENKEEEDGDDDSPPPPPPPLQELTESHEFSAYPSDPEEKTNVPSDEEEEDNEVAAAGSLSMTQQPASPTSTLHRTTLAVEDGILDNLSHISTSSSTPSKTEVCGLTDEHSGPMVRAEYMGSIVVPAGASSEATTAEPSRRADGRRSTSAVSPSPAPQQAQSSAGPAAELEEETKRATEQSIRRGLAALFLILVIVIIAVSCAVTRPHPGKQTVSSSSSSSSSISATRCFQTMPELYAAVDAYLVNSSRPSSSSLAAAYGWPLNEWCVGHVPGFDFLFSPLRNPAARVFNEELGQWNLSSALSIRYVRKYDARDVGLG